VELYIKPAGFVDQEACGTPLLRSIAACCLKRRCAVDFRAD
jgi:hypothetical protein